MARTSKSTPRYGMAHTVAAGVNKPNAHSSRRKNEPSTKPATREENPPATTPRTRTPSRRASQGTMRGYAFASSMKSTDAWYLDQNRLQAAVNKLAPNQRHTRRSMKLDFLPAHDEWQKDIRTRALEGNDDLSDGVNENREEEVGDGADESLEPVESRADVGQAVDVPSDFNVDGHHKRVMGTEEPAEDRGGTREDEEDDLAEDEQSRDIEGEDAEDRNEHERVSLPRIDGYITGSSMAHIGAQAHVSTQEPVEGLVSTNAEAMVEEVISTDSGTTLDGSGNYSQDPFDEAMEKTPILATQPLLQIGQPEFFDPFAGGTWQDSARNRFQALVLPESKLAVFHKAYPRLSDTQHSKFFQRTGDDLLECWEEHARLGDAPLCTMSEALTAAELDPSFPVLRMVHADCLIQMHAMSNAAAAQTSHQVYVASNLLGIDPRSATYKRGGALTRIGYHYPREVQDQQYKASQEDVMVCDPLYCRECKVSVPERVLDLQGKPFVHRSDLMDIFAILKIKDLTYTGRSTKFGHYIQHATELESQTIILRGCGRVEAAVCKPESCAICRVRLRPDGTWA